jgi:transposase-like protein
MSKYSPQFKLKVVKDYLKSGGQRRLAHLYEINTSDIRKWTLSYQSNGLSSLKKRVYQHYTPEFKKSVIQYVKAHEVSLRAAAAHFNIPDGSVITVWQKLYNEGGIAALQAKPKGRVPMPKPFKPFVPTNKPVTQMTPEELMQELEYRRVEADYLKKLEALAQQKHLASKNKSKSSLS